ncbi:hypothetical protein GCM10027089_40740 [Nocardia thraciensis]
MTLSAIPANKRSWQRLFSVVLAVVLVVLVSGAEIPTVHAGPTPTPVPAVKEDYELRQVFPGDPMHIPALIYRYRHTEDLVSKAPASDPAILEYVTWARNIAAFQFTVNGQIYALVAPSLNQFPYNTTTALIDIYRLDDPGTGRWSVVDKHLQPLVDPQGNPADNWRTTRHPSHRWTVTQHLAIDVERKRTGLHSERVADHYWTQVIKQQNPAATTPNIGFSERIPCQSKPQCRRNLATGAWFPELRDMRYLTEETDKRPASAAQKSMMEVYDRWTRWDSPTGPGASAQMGYRSFTTPGDAPGHGPATQALEPGADPGGIDFSTLQLRYLTENDSGALEYAFDAASAATGPKVAEGRTALAHASDAFFVWLSLPPSAFWVNLGPGEPDRIIDDRLGTTDVGRILLQADFRMKQLVGSLIHPDSPLGQQFWGTTNPLDNACLSMRQWIVPLPAQVYEEQGGLYIVNAPLDVKSESDYLSAPGQGDNSCPVTDPRLEAAFRSLVLPKVKDAINQAPEFTELRQVYLSRVAAEWYRQRHSTDGTLSSLIDSGDVTDWPALHLWSPREIYDQYVDSYRNNKDFAVTKQIQQGDDIYEVTYTHGGVDFSQLQLNQLTQSAFEHEHRGLADAVGQSFDRSTPGEQGKTVLGASSEPLAWQNTTDRSSYGLAGILAIAAMAIVACTTGFYISLRWRRPPRPQSDVFTTAAVVHRPPPGNDTQSPSHPTQFTPPRIWRNNAATPAADQPAPLPAPDQREQTQPPNPAHGIAQTQSYLGPNRPHPGQSSLRSTPLWILAAVSVLVLIAATAIIAVTMTGSGFDHAEKTKSDVTPMYTADKATNACGLVDVSILEQWAKNPAREPQHNERKSTAQGGGGVSCSALNEGTGYPPEFATLRMEGQLQYIDPDTGSRLGEPIYNAWENSAGTATGTNRITGALPGIGERAYFELEDDQSSARPMVNYTAAAFDNNLSIKVSIGVGVGEGHTIDTAEVKAAVLAQLRTAMDRMKA